MKNKIHFLWHEPQIPRAFGAGVSLHSHTMHSRESLAAAPDYARQNPLVGLAVAALSARYKAVTGSELDFSLAFFTPPLSASEAYLVEAGQIEMDLGLSPMVSLTDHDAITAPSRLRWFMSSDQVPLSLEWTVPFGPAYFHIGIHNLPDGREDEILNDLAAIRCRRCRLACISCTGDHTQDSIGQASVLLERLNAYPDTLIVLNHPLWDTLKLGPGAHKRLLSEFLSQCGSYIHALELNGLRSWNENLDVMKLAEEWRMPVISGGDRHGCEPNAVLNLTTQSTFSEFAAEVRSGVSEVLFMRQYRQPLRLRKIQTVWDVLRELRQPAGRSGFADRVFVPWPDGRVLPLSASVWPHAAAARNVLAIRNAKPSEQVEAP